MIIGALDEPTPTASQPNFMTSQAQSINQSPMPPFIVTYINSARESRCYYLADLARHGASQPIRERLNYVASVLDEFVELDKQIS